jgi:hypothetical protein
MAIIKGEKEYKKWEEGERLSRKEAMLVHCYICNGMEEGAIDCKGKDSCSLYPFYYYKGRRQAATPISLP